MSLSIRHRRLISASNATDLVFSDDCSEAMPGICVRHVLPHRVPPVGAPVGHYVVATTPGTRLNRNSTPRGDESPVLAHIEKITTAAS